jgi:ABC-2 type transport system permease protein
MRRFLVLLVKEERALFSSPIAYVLIAVFLLIMGYSFTLALFISHSMTLVHLFFQIFVLFLLTVPIITMRLIAEERKILIGGQSSAAISALCCLLRRSSESVCSRRH